MPEPLRKREDAKPASKPFAEPKPSTFSFRTQEINPNSSVARAADDALEAPIPGKLASQTRVNPGAMAPSAASHIAALTGSGLRDEVVPGDGIGDEDDGYPPDALPARISKELSTQSGSFNPEWHQVRNLPGYMLSAIRALGRRIFDTYTTTPIEDLQVLSSMTNDQTEVQMMAALLKKRGKRLHQGEMSFQNMPGYKAQVAAFEMGRGQFLAVKDESGEYIYAWPTEDGKFHASDLEGGPEAEADRHLPAPPRQLGLG